MKDNSERASLGLGTRVDARLREEAERFSFRFACESCAYFDDARGRCSEGYPTDEHRGETLERDVLVFCKLYEGS